MTGYKLKLLRQDGRPPVVVTTHNPVMVAATIEGWIDKAPAAWFDEHGELTVELTHNGGPIDTAVLAEHIQAFRDLTGDAEAIAAARAGNPKRRQP